MLSRWVDMGIRVATALATGAGIWLLGMILARLAQNRLGKINPGAGALLGRALRIAGVVLAVFFVAVSLGFSWKGALASAGIVGTLLTMLITFSAQASISNIFSGIFIILERAFHEGDVVKVGSETGVVERIGMTSTWLRTFDNVLVRVPNSTLLNSDIRNYTRFDIRRIDISVGIAYKDDPEKAVEILMNALDGDPMFLARPKPLVMAQELGDSSVNLWVAAWIDRRDYLEAKSRLVHLVKRALEDAGVEIPFPQIVVHQ